MFLKCLNRALDARRSSHKNKILTLFFLLFLGVISGSVFVVIVALVVGVIVSGLNLLSTDYAKFEDDSDDSDKAHNYGSNGSNGSDGSTGS